MKKAPFSELETGPMGKKNISLQEKWVVAERIMPDNREGKSVRRWILKTKQRWEGAKWIFR
jgi:hypothetical protein